MINTIKRSLLLLYLCMLCALFGGCEPKWDFGSVNFEPQIVVEGWIESGGYPCVCLTQTKTLDMLLDSAALFDVAIRWAKVTVSDGTNSEVLTGRIDKRYTPPFIYTGSNLRGETGKYYTLKIEYSGRTVTATTYIPEPVELDQITASKCDDSDTLYQIRATFRDTPTEKNYYKFFTQVLHSDKRYFSSFLGTFDDTVLPTDGNAVVEVYRGFRFTDLKKYTPFYKEQDTVSVKFTQIPQDGFLFWSDYENEVTNGKNPIFPSSSNLKSNIKGGLGIWCGYGTSTYLIPIKKNPEEKKKGL